MRVLILLAALAWAPPAEARVDVAGVDERPGAQVPADLTVIGPDGARLRLSAVFGEAPTVLVLAYYRCPLLCDRIVGSLAHALPAARAAAGQDYRVLVVSIDPRDTPGVAAEKSRDLLASLTELERPRWHLTVDDDGSAARIAAAVGFRYRYDNETDQFAHPAVAIALTPDGRVSRYLYGVSFPPGELAMALRDAAGGREVASLERVLLTCFKYVPALQRHAGTIAWILRGGTSVLFAGLAMSLILLVRRGHRRRKEASRV